MLAWTVLGAAVSLLDPRPALPKGDANETVIAAVLRHVDEAYVAPERVRSRDMMVAGLEAVVKKCPELALEGAASTPAITLRAGQTTTRVDLEKLDSTKALAEASDKALSWVRQYSATAGRLSAVDLDVTFASGMLSTLDAHSQVLDPKTYAEMKISTSGRFGGLGMVVQLKDGVPRVVQVIRGSGGDLTPAMKAGIRRDDRLLEVDGVSTTGLPLDAVVSRLRGPEGSQVTVTVMRDGWAAAQRFTMTRSSINVPALTATLLADRIGYIHLTQLPATATSTLTAVLTDLTSKAGGELKGLVLDLRGCPGGLLDEAVHIVDQFIDHGVVVATSGRGAVKERREAKVGDAYERLPLVMLADEGTASGCEIITGALRRLDRAPLLGRRTYGKGNVQVIYDLPGGAALKLTIATYLAGGDLPVDQIGIEPDVELVPQGGPPPPPPTRTAPAREQPMASLSYVEVPADPAVEVPLAQPVEVARGLLVVTPRSERSTMLNLGRGYFADQGRSGPKSARSVPSSVASASTGRLTLRTPATILVLDLKPVGKVPEHVPALVSKLLMTALDNVVGLKTIGVDDVQAMLDVQRKKDLLGCDSVACVADIGGALGTDVVLYGQLGILGRRYNVNATLVDRSGGVRGRISWLVDANEDTVADRLPELVERIIDKLNAAP